MIVKNLRVCVISPILVLLKNYTMKILQSSHISPFGGLNFVLEEIKRLKIDNLINSHLPTLPSQSTYSWYDILASYWSVFFCGGDCAEDLSTNLKYSLIDNPFLKLPSPDRVISRIKSLATESNKYNHAGNGKSNHEFNINTLINELNLKILKSLSTYKSDNNILDYDNTLIHCQKADAKYTYHKKTGYSPGVALIGNNVVYVEGRNGNSAPQTLQEDTFERMFELFEKENIKIKTVRADSASYALKTIQTIEKYAETFVIRARMSTPIEQAISKIKNWESITIGERQIWRGSTMFKPFVKSATKHKIKSKELKEYRLVITKEKRADGQMNLFTGEAYNYSAIITNDFQMTDNEVVFFYNDRGTAEKSFDELKNDFGWSAMPFSKMNQNTVFLLIMAMCKNIYNHIIATFSERYRNLEKQFRIKKFIFRFICMPAKWVSSGRTIKLRLYGDIALKT